MPTRPRALVTVLCAAVLGALLPAATAHAENRTVQGGRLDWGIKSSFQSYVTGPVAKGSFSLTGGAATVGGGGFRFHSAAGGYDGDEGTFRASFSGGVRFLGHGTESGGHQLDLTISSPTVSISGSSGTLHVDVVSRARGTGAVTTSRQVPFASLSLGGIDMRGGGTSVVLDNLPATLTAQGARSFAGYYTAGTALDPVSLSADVQQAAAGRPPNTPEPTSPAPKETSKKKPATEERTELTDGAVDWGVRRTYREYVTGDIAQGRWTLSSGALDGGALYRFPGGEGTFEDGDLTAAFDGTVRFTGGHGLDLRLSAVRVTVENDRGTLYADVRSPDHSARNAPLVTFAAKDLKAEDGLARLTEAPAKLTADGAEAFGGMYPEGTAMDPVSLAVALTDDAGLPALPDLGSTPTPETASPEAATGPSAEPVASTVQDDGGGLPLLPLALAAGLLSALAAVAAFLVRRRRAQPAADTATLQGTSQDTQQSTSQRH
ncbi:MULTISPECIES: HtaA domain-containing protein [unclassified Streptomyces]|uniref:HtaA domain-containing protein n=1 Tax=unclassified Streptomyces TaxID=2593676 RepID=UPI00073BB75C|nr:HtaA domain-containing protein [Streptomyces sp. AVP053U2]ODA69868.1 Htaa [Streptomyces sp. AVP053U2]